MENAFFLNRVSLCRMTGYTEHTDWLLLFNPSMPTKSCFFSHMCISHLPFLKMHSKNTKALNTFVTGLNIKIKTYLLWNPQMLQELAFKYHFLEELYAFQWCLFPLSLDTRVFSFDLMPRSTHSHKQVHTKPFLRVSFSQWEGNPEDSPSDMQK